MCRLERSINSKQQSKSISGSAVYQQRGITVHQQQSKTQVKALLDDTVVSNGAVYQPRSCISTALETGAKALLMDTAVSTWAVYQPRSAQLNHHWRSCISPARYTNRDQQSGMICQPNINSNQKLCRKHFLTIQSRRPVRYIKPNQRRKSTSSAAEYHQRGKAV